MQVHRRSKTSTLASSCEALWKHPISQMFPKDKNCVFIPRHTVAGEWPAARTVAFPSLFIKEQQPTTKPAHVRASNLSRFIPLFYSCWGQRFPALLMVSR